MKKITIGIVLIVFATVLYFGNQKEEPEESAYPDYFEGVEVPDAVVTNEAKEKVEAEAEQREEPAYLDDTTDPFYGYDDTKYEMVVYRANAVMESNSDGMVVEFKSLKESEKLDKYDLAQVSVDSSLDDKFLIRQSALILPAEVNDLYVFKVEKSSGQIVDNTKYWVGKSDTAYNYNR